MDDHQFESEELERLEIDLRTLRRRLAMTVDPAEVRRVRAEIRALEEYQADIQAQLISHNIVA